MSFKLAVKTGCLFIRFPPVESLPLHLSPSSGYCPNLHALRIFHPSFVDFFPIQGFANCMCTQPFPPRSGFLLSGIDDLGTVDYPPRKPGQGQILVLIIYP